MMNIALTNLGKYNEGVLDFVWLTLPATEEEIAKAFDQIQVSHDEIHYYSNGNGQAALGGADLYGEYEESFITDFECDYYDINEYENLDRLNEIAEAVESLNDYDMEIVKALMSDGYSLEEALDLKDDVMVYSDCKDMTDVAYQYAEETGLLDQIPDHLQSYFDFEAFGRDMSFEGHWIETDNGFIEVLR